MTFKVNTMTQWSWRHGLMFFAAWAAATAILVAAGLAEEPRAIAAAAPASNR